MDENTQAKFAEKVKELLNMAKKKSADRLPMHLQSCMSLKIYLSWMPEDMAL